MGHAVFIGCDLGGHGPPVAGNGACEKSPTRIGAGDHDIVTLTMQMAANA
jgi:hypothetical protein